MNASADRTVLVIGVGNDQRGDDAAGLEVARRLRAHSDGSFSVATSSGDYSELAQLWKNRARVIVVDAVGSGGRAGRIYRFDVRREPIPADFFHCSTHSFGLAEAIEFARTFDELPPEIEVVGLEGRHFEMGGELSTEVREGIEAVAAMLFNELLESKYAESKEV